MNPIQQARSRNSRTSKEAFAPSVTFTRPSNATPTYAVGDVWGSNTGQASVSATVTITNGANAVVTWGGGTPAAHGMTTGDAVMFKTTPGAIGTGLADDTKYYVIVIDETTFYLATSLANALIGGTTQQIDTSGVTGATCTCAKIGSAILAFENCGVPGDMTVLKQAIFYNDKDAVYGNHTGFTLHLYSQSPPSVLLDNDAWSLPAVDLPYYLGYVTIGTPVDVGPSLVVQTAILDKYFSTPTGTLYGYLAMTGSDVVTPVSGSVSRLQLFAVSA